MALHSLWGLLCVRSWRVCHKVVLILVWFSSGLHLFKFRFDAVFWASFDPSSMREKLTASRLSHKIMHVSTQYSCKLSHWNNMQIVIFNWCLFYVCGCALTIAMYCLSEAEMKWCHKAYFVNHAFFTPHFRDSNGLNSTVAVQMDGVFLCIHCFRATELKFSFLLCFSRETEVGVNRQLRSKEICARQMCCAALDLLNQPTKLKP